MTTACVIGAGSALGRALVKELVAAGHGVVAVVRSEAQRAELEELGAEPRLADARDVAALAQAMGDRVDVVFSLVRGQEPDGTRTDALCNERILEAARARAGRFVLVSSVGVGDSRAALPPPARAAMAAALESKERSEQLVRTSPLAFTIVRPGRLVDGPPTESARLVEDPAVNGAISRASLAALLARSGFDPGAVGKTYTAVGS